MNDLLRKLVTAAMAAFFVTMATSADAAFTLNIDNAMIAPGGTAQIQVTVTSDTPGGDEIDTFGLLLLIEPVIGTTSGLEFATLGPDDFRVDPSYILFGNSLNAELPDDPREVTTTNTNRDTYYDTDFQNDFLMTTAPGTSLVGVIDLEHIVPGGGAGLATIGDSFTITAVPGLAETAFFDESLDMIPFTATPGVITVAATAVPEPSTWVLCAGLAGAVIRRRRKKSVEAKS